MTEQTDPNTQGPAAASDEKAAEGQQASAPSALAQNAQEGHTQPSASPHPGQPRAPAPQAQQQWPRPSLARMVIVREPNMPDAPGVVTAVLPHGMIDCNVFRGDHTLYASANLPEISPATNGRGWFWPPRV